MHNRIVPTGRASVEGPRTCSRHNGLRRTRSVEGPTVSRHKNPEISLLNFVRARRGLLFQPIMDAVQGKQRNRPKYG